MVNGEDFQPTGRQVADSAIVVTEELLQHLSKK